MIIITEKRPIYAKSNNNIFISRNAYSGTHVSFVDKNSMQVGVICEN